MGARRERHRDQSHWQGRHVSPALFSPGANRPNKLRYYGSMLVAFVAANVAVLSPDTWRYCVEYVQGTHLVHHGYLYAGQLYVTNIPISPLGVPATFYLRLLATKVPLAVLGAAAAGLIEVVRRRRERGFGACGCCLSSFRTR